MTTKFPPLRKSKEWTEWINCVEKSDFLNMYTSQEVDGKVPLLPRHDIMLYGEYPSIEPRMFVTCIDCSKLIQYSGIKAHWVYYHFNKKHNEQSPIETTNLATTVKEKCTPARNKNKSILPKNVPLRPLFPKTAASPSSPSSMPVELPPPILQPVQMESASSNNIAPPVVVHQSHNNRHKKPKKQVSVTTKEHEIDKHAEVNKAHREAKSSTSKNHHVSSKKIAPGRNKNLDHSKVTKEVKRSTFTSPVPIAPKMSPKKVSMEQALQPVTPATTPTKSIPKICPTKSEMACDVSVINSTTLVLQPVQHAVIPTSVNKPASPEFASQERKTIDVLMPMSPVTVISPVQLVGVPLLHLPPSPIQPLIVSLPVQSNSSKMYKHPKPLIMSSVSTRKIGGTFFLQNQHLERQRSEINLKLNCKPINTLHKPNILKCRSVRGNTKRSYPEKLINSECKQPRLTPDVNGFILHADVSESAEAPQSNSSILEKNCFVK